MKIYVFQKLQVEDLSFKNIAAFCHISDAIKAAENEYTDLSGNCSAYMDEVIDNKVTSYIICSKIKGYRILGRIVKCDI